MKWQYCSAKDMAEADGGAGAAEIIIRKAVGSGDNTAELSDASAGRPELKNMAYAHEWNSKLDGTDVHLYGNKEGKAMKATWTDGKYSYSILALGQGDTWKDFGLGEDDITILVKGTKKAETKQENKESSNAAAAQGGEEESDEPGFDVEQAVWNAGLGALVSYYAVQGEDGNTYWAVTTRGSDDNEYVTYMDNAGNVVEDMEVGDVADNDGDGGGLDVEQAVWDNGLGEYVSYYTVQGEDGNTYYAVTTRGADGNEYTTYMDGGGNVVEDMEVGDVVDG